jgi:3-hydroxyacyl-CoA dehydrogenase
MGIRNMSDLVQVTKQDDVAVITINNPPVNALSPGVLEEIEAAIERINRDDGVRTAVLIGAGSTFVVGADINEFVKMTSGLREPGNLQLPLRKIEDSPKPVIVAIHGNALGGGLELAMACHYRVAVPSARVGQPEVKLGLIPGAAGTQRLPLLAGVVKAVEMCTDGKPVKAADAVKAGILDKLIDGELLAGAVAFAREVASRVPPKTRERINKLRTREANSLIFTTARESVRKKHQALQAPLAAIDAIEAGTQLTFEEGCKKEREIFRKCLFSDQSKALVHVFLAERETSKIPDVSKNTPAVLVKQVGVVGAGTKGTGIAAVCAEAGLTVVIKDISQAALDIGIAAIQKIYANSVKRGRLTQKDVDERMKLIKPTLDYSGFAAADLVIEAVFESIDVKKRVFGELDRVCKQGAIMASNTSTLNIDEIAASTSRPEDVIGTHFFSPVNAMRLLELVRGAKTRKEVISTCMQLSKKIGKVAVLVGNCLGFVGNRMFIPYIEEAQLLVKEGAAPEAVDKALYDFGMAMGPFAMEDMAGLDVVGRIRREIKHQYRAGARRLDVEDCLCELGRLGRKTGIGWYRYDAEWLAIPDPEIAEWLRMWRAGAAIPQRDISAEEIVERCVYTLINVGARILGEHYTLRAGDVDTVLVNGYGFPAFRGGPMWYADAVGVKKIYGRVREFQKQHGDFWEPAPLLKELSESNGRLADFQRT